MNKPSLSHPRILKTAFPAFALITLIGCSVKFPEVSFKATQKIIPTIWSSSKAATVGVDRNWIKRFKDPALSQLVTEALKNNANLAASAENISRAQQNAKIAGAVLYPQASFGVQTNRQESIFFGIPGGVSARNNTFGTSLDASWELDLWGRVRTARQATAAEWQGAQFDFEGAKLSLSAQVAKAYFALAEANQQVEQSKAAVRVREQTREAISERYFNAIAEEGGTGSQLRIAISDLETSKAELARWESEVDRVSRQLELLVGRYPSAKIKGRARLPEVTKVPPVGLPSELLLRRPDILSAERQYTASTLRIKEAKLAFFPTLSLVGSLGTTTTEAQNILSSDFGVWSIGAGILQPILTGGRLAAEKELRSSDQRRNLKTLQDTVLGAFGEVETYLAADQYLKRRVEAMSAAFSSAQEASEVSRLDYRDGASTILTVLEAESRMITTASTLATLRRLQLDNRINLHLALGGDFSLKK